MSESTMLPPPSGQPRPGPRPTAPNYAARRMLVTTIVITLVFVVALLGWRLVSGEDGGFSSGDAMSWNRIAMVDRSTGAVVTVNGDGEVQDEIVGGGRVVDVYAQDDRLALVGRDQITIVDPGGDEPIVIPFDGPSTITRLPTGNMLELVVGEPTGGNVTVVDGSSGVALDIAAIAGQNAPLLFAETIQYDHDGRIFAVADAANFQTIVVRTDEPDAMFLPDAPLAVGSDRMATSQTVGQRADIGLFDADGKRLTTVQSAIPAGGMIVDKALIYVTIDGGIFRIVDDSEEPERLGALAVPGGATIRWVRPIMDGERLVVGGDVFEAIIDLDGNTVFTTTFTSPLEIPEPMASWSCLPVGGDIGFHSIVSADTGEQVADLSGVEIAGISADGCTVIGQRAKLTRLIGVDGDVSVGAARAAYLGPDGRTVVTQKPTGEWEAVTYDDELSPGEPVDLSAVAPSAALVVFLDG